MKKVVFGVALMAAMVLGGANVYAQTPQKDAKTEQTCKKDCKKDCKKADCKKDCKKADCKKACDDKKACDGQKAKECCKKK